MNNTNAINLSEIDKLDISHSHKNIKKFIILCVINPVAALPVLAFFIGYFWPNHEHTINLQEINIGLNNYINLRIANSDYMAAAYLFWLTVILTIPAQIIWMYLTSAHINMPIIARSFMLINLHSKNWDPNKYTLIGGYVRLIGYSILAIVFILGIFLTGPEPSSCRGCETKSIVGFFFLNWTGIYLLMAAWYLGITYTTYWKSIRNYFGETYEQQQK